MTDQQIQTQNDVITKLYYLTPLDEYNTTKPYYVNWPVHDIQGAQQTNLSHTSYENILIRDIRGLGVKCEIDVQGFQLETHPTSLNNEDFDDDALIREKYYPEMSELAKNTLNASRVFIFEHTHRVQNPTLKGCGCSRKRKPLVSAHIDQTPASSEQRVRYHLGGDAENLLKGRFQVVNTWRPLFGPLKGYPLTLGDARTFDLNRDGVPTDLVFPHYVGESLNLLHHPDQRWYYASEQNRDEVWLFKCYDSATGVAQAAPHCSFDIQDGQFSERPRESVEVRMLVFYN
ncbi:hypothetical protein FE257_004444 [Aspergillus nanangensis]|uniref:Methyltransferase n=1 Tax=Aspergillus nanangensis TaxID=2582783 RepID=A0AAD4H0L1_ASPNN|nr:hypothetical protein FE257_004444 [Aspergillus nanangensis]